MSPPVTQNIEIAKEKGLCISAQALNSLAPRVGFEPTTYRLTVECSTAELPGNNRSPRCEWANTNACSICQAVF